jgi:hypothetical protein
LELITGGLKTMLYQEFLVNLKQKWKQGQHLTISGPTGMGKTYLASDLLTFRQYVIAITTKKKDKTLERYSGYYKIKKWHTQYGEDRLLFNPHPKELGNFVYQRVQIYECLSEAFLSGGWAVYFDDLFYISNTLKLKEVIQMLYTQSRSNNITLVASIQRPSWIPVECISQSTYVIILKTHDRKDLDRLSEATGMDRKIMQELNEQLSGYSFLFVENGKNVELIERI